MSVCYGIDMRATGRKGLMEMKGIHGGDIYRNDVKLDFSLNVNPLGIPEAVKTALYEEVANCDKYPDITADRLKKAVSEMLAVPKEYVLFGNGASELFIAIIHGITPKKTVIPVPSFYGYEYAAKAEGGQIVYYETKKENDFCLQSDFLSVLTEEVTLLFLANPNNPTGNLMSRKELIKVLDHCRDKGIYVVLDECFIEFCERGCSMLQEIERFSNLILVRAFTKIFAIPGVRLGYLVCSNPLSTVEMAETAVFNLFQHMAEAEQFSLMLLANEDKLVRICAYNLVCRLLKRNNECTPQLYAALFKKAAIDLKSADRQLLYPLVKCLDYVSSTDTEQAKEATQLLKEAGFGAF